MKLSSFNLIKFAVISALDITVLLVSDSKIAFSPSIVRYASQPSGQRVVTLIVSSALTTSGRDRKEWAQIGVIIVPLQLGYIMGPPADSEYAVDPVGVEIITPSE